MSPRVLAPGVASLPKLRPFQREDVDFIKAHGVKVLVASAPGTGKTPVAIRSLVETYRVSLPAVVVCPASVTRNWAREFKKWGKGVRVIIIDDSDTRIPSRFQNTPTVFIISWALLAARWTDLVRLRVKAVVADEAHYAKNPESLRSQALYQLTRQATGVLLLTGTPIINIEAELEALQDLLGTSNPPMIRRLLEDVAPEVPPKKRSYLHIRLRDKHQREYDHADEDFETWLRTEKEKLLGAGMADVEVERTLAAEALAKIGYLRRLAGEYKVPAAVDWISRAVRIGEPVVVFLEHQNVLKRLVKGLRRQRIRHCVLDGSTPSKRRQEMIDQFQANEYPVFLCTKAGKEGITLTAARHLLFLERFYTSAEEEQAEDRIRRIGQKYPTTIWFLHAHGTVDTRIDTIVRDKRAIVRTAIGSADILETPTGNVSALIRQWSSYAAPDEENIQSLGRGDPLPPLPSPRDTHGIVFHGERWTPGAARTWCRMNGYCPEKQVQLGDRLKMVLHGANVFQPNKFTSYSVCQDVKIIVGRRLGRTAAPKRKKRPLLR